MNRSKRYTDDDVRAAVASSRTIAQVLRKLGLVPRGSNYRTYHRLVSRLAIDTSHILGHAWSRGLERPDISRRQRSLDGLLVLGSKVKTDALRQRLIRSGLKAAACEMCHRIEWNGRPIPLELDHINGDPEDNRLENLRILCPNCHAQTPTYRARNIRRSSQPPYPNRQRKAA